MARNVSSSTIKEATCGMKREKLDYNSAQHKREGLGTSEVLEECSVAFGETRWDDGHVSTSYKLGLHPSRSKSKGNRWQASRMPRIANANSRSADAPLRSNTEVPSSYKSQE